MQKPKLLITGASGFTGRYLVSAAGNQGYQCFSMAQSVEHAHASEGETVVADLSSPQQVQQLIQKIKPDFIVHLAAISFVAHDDAAEIYKVNQLGTINLLEAVQKCCPQVEKILIASSANIYGNAATLPITEETPPSPINHYGVSKAAMEMATSLYGELPVVICRPFNYTGRGQSSNFLLPKIVGAYRARKLRIELGNLDVSRDFSDVRDVVAAYLRLLQSGNRMSTYNICSGTPTSLLAIIELLNGISGYEIEVSTNPMFARSEEIKTLYGSPALLESDIGPYRKYSLHDTLTWMLGE